MLTDDCNYACCYEQAGLYTARYLEMMRGAILASLRANPEAEEVLQSCRFEPALGGAAPGFRCQFERLGYFCADSDGASGKPVFNRTVTLRDTWAKLRGKGA